MSKKSECVRVVVRCRPMLEMEEKSNYTRVVDMDISRGVVRLTNPKGKIDEQKREFTFDSVYDWNSKQRDLYDETFRSIVDAVLQGYNGTVFAYGQTGTGKTFTMEGDRSKEELRGVIPSSFDHIFTHISRSENEQYLVRASYLEIYQEEIRDLLSKNHKHKLELKERPDIGVYVKDLSSFVSKSVKEIEHVMTVGNQNRVVGRTEMNEHSSRSHAIFIVTVECSAQGSDGDNHIRVGKLNLVDLAGSERQSKTQTSGERFKEATKINLSLSCLGNVISALVDGKSTHIPYRDSKLTRLLQDSLGGNAKTVMVANVGPADYNYEETLMTLRYANRAKNITNKPYINEDPKDALLREYQEEITRLKDALDKRKQKGGTGEGKKRKKRSHGGEDDEEDEEEDGDDHELKTKQEELEKEKAELLQNTELLDEERERLIAEVQQREEMLLKEQRRRSSLASKIRAMESKLLAGSAADRADETKRALELKHQEVIEQKRREREIKQQLEAQEEMAGEIKETFTSLQEEVELKTKKLIKLRAKLKSARAEIADFREEQIRVREELALTLASLQREQKLRNLIIENFVPSVEAEKVASRAEYNQEEDDWILKPYQSAYANNTAVEARPRAKGNSIRPVSVFARTAAQNGNPRYMEDNILKVELDLPNRTTRDYSGPSMPSSLQAALNAAFQEGDEIVFDATPFNTSAVSNSPAVQKVKGNKSKSNVKDDPKKSLTPTAKTPSTGDVNYPKSRGLVSQLVRFA